MSFLNFKKAFAAVSASAVVGIAGAQSAPGATAALSAQATSAPNASYVIKGALPTPKTFSVSQMTEMCGVNSDYARHILQDGAYATPTTGDIIVDNDAKGVSHVSAILLGDRQPDGRRREVKASTDGFKQLVNMQVDEAKQTKGSDPFTCTVDAMYIQADNQLIQILTAKEAELQGNRAGTTSVTPSSTASVPANTAPARPADSAPNMPPSQPQVFKF